MAITLEIDPRRVKAVRDPMLYGHFLEHFHRQVYRGIFDPGNPLSDADGFRTDVIEAMNPSYGIRYNSGALYNYTSCGSPV